MSDAGDVAGVFVPVRDLVPGDELVLPSGLQRRVVRVEAFDELTGADPGERLRVIVSGGRVEAYEGVRSGQAGARLVDVDEQGLRPFRPDELVRVARG